MARNNIIGIIGGTGLYQLEGMTDVSVVNVDTPFGLASSEITTGYLGKTKLLFLARHGKDHTITPTEINAKANIYALKKLGANFCLSVSAVGSLCEEFKPGEIVIPDQLIDRTIARDNTFFGSGIVAHVAFGDPFCINFSKLVYECAKEISIKENKVVHNKGTYVCMEGPAFSTRAESELYRSWGAKLIGMTALPEAKLAREAELSYCTMALVTDYDCWRTSESEVEVHEIIKIINSNVNFAKKVINDLASKIDTIVQKDSISNALRDAILTPKEIWPKKRVEELDVILEKYLNDIK